jgi:putative NIF3 family GTP cyclohydrolase 1 type 2
LKLIDIYRLAIAVGIKNDPRGENGVKAYLAKVKKEYETLTQSQKAAFDKEKLANPFSDTRILNGDPNKEIKNIMAGIDIETEEVLLAETLGRKGRRIDLLLAHHPEGFARSIFYEVMNVQLDILAKAGLNPKKTKELLDERMDEVMRKVLAANTMRPVDAAKMLDISYMCAHTVADNCVASYLNRLISVKKPKTVAGIIDILMHEPEYKYAQKTNAGPKLILGKPENKCGKVLIEMTGGTEGPKKIFPQLVKAGIKTIVGMHMSEEHFKKAKKYKLNVLIAGHISSDNLGLNLLLDGIDKRHQLNIIECSGFRRFRRN